MSEHDDSKSKPALTPRKAESRAAREARLAEALRQNLKRRKAQARGRVDNLGAGDDPSCAGKDK